MLDNHKKNNNKIRNRLIFLLILLTIFFLFFIGKFFWIQVIESEKYEKIALSQRLRELNIESKRGIIYDSNGNQLAVNTSAKTIVAIPEEIDNPSTLARQLEKILDMDYDLIYKRLTSEASAKYIQRKVDESIVEEIKNLDPDGIFFKEESQRYYPKNDLASQVLGFAGIDNQGLEGIELSYDKYIHGLSGKKLIEQDASGRILPDSVRKNIPSQNGYNIYLTIDEVIQYIVEREIDNAMDEFDISGASAIVMDPHDASILAMASTPDYNPNNFADYSKKHWRNKAISDSYEPGSTFKIITTAAALEEGVVSEGDSFYCPGSVEVAGESIDCWKTAGHGHENFTEVVTNSCNPGFVQVGMRVGKENFYNYIEAFGFGEKTSIKLPGEAEGLLNSYDKIGPVELATMSFGQGIAVTPIQLITAVSAVANDGTLLEPKLVEKITDENNKIVKNIEKTPVRQVITKNTAERTRELLRKVVEEGTGSNASIDGFDIGGKTGTAKHYYDEIYDSSFIGMVPTNNPRFVILVVLYDASGESYYGSQIAAPVFRNILHDILRYKDISPENSNESPKFINENQVEIPDVVDKNILEAEKELRKLGVDVKLIGNGENVVMQIPFKNTNINKNSTVRLFTEQKAIDNSNYYVAVPDFKEKSLSVAKNIANQVGIKLQIDGNRDKIVRQDIKPGKRIKAGSVVLVDTQ
ncbi:MAG: penicillin-binding transpeptidase domain-containing protein [Bacillota bacterium]